MAVIKKPAGRGTKGAPPAELQASQNLSKSEDYELRPLNFKVPAEFKRDFKSYATQLDISMVDLLQKCFDFYRENKILTK